MSIAEITAELDRLSDDEQEQVATYLKIKRQMQNKDFREELTRKISDKDPANWATIEEAEKRLFPET